MQERVIILDDKNDQIISYIKDDMSLIHNHDNTKVLFDFLKQGLQTIPNLREIKKQLDPNERFQLVIDPEMMKKIKEGTLKIARKKDNAEDILPIFKNTNGKFEKQVILREHYTTPDIDASINGLIMQQQFKEILDKIEQMNISLERILQGQENDRIGVQRSAKQLILEANNVRDVEFKRMLLVQAIKTANDSRFLLLETMRQDVEYITNLPKTTWQQVLSKQSSKKIDERMCSIRRAFNAINVSTMVCCMAYYQMEEYEAMKSSLLPYRKMLEQYLENDKRILKYLNEYDSETDNFWLNKPEEILHNIDAISDESMQSNIIIEIPMKLLLEE